MQRRRHGRQRKARLRRRERKAPQSSEATTRLSSAARWRCWCWARAVCARRAVQARPEPEPAQQDRRLRSRPRRRARRAAAARSSDCRTGCGTSSGAGRWPTRSSTRRDGRGRRSPARGQVPTVMGWHWSVGWQRGRAGGCRCGDERRAIGEVNAAAGINVPGDLPPLARRGGRRVHHRAWPVGERAGPSSAWAASSRPRGGPSLHRDGHAPSESAAWNVRPRSTWRRWSTPRPSAPRRPSSRARACATTTPAAGGGGPVVAMTAHTDSVGRRRHRSVHRTASRCGPRNGAGTVPDGALTTARSRCCASRETWSTPAQPRRRSRRAGGVIGLGTHGVYLMRQRRRVHRR